MKTVAGTEVGYARSEIGAILPTFTVRSNMRTLSNFVNRREKCIRSKLP